MWNITFAKTPFQTVLGSVVANRIETPKRVGIVTLSSLAFVARRQSDGNYSSMIPLFRPIIAACVRSFAPSLERMHLTRLLTVSES